MLGFDGEGGLTVHVGSNDESLKVNGSGLMMRMSH